MTIEIELQIILITVQDVNTQESYTGFFPVSQACLPVQILPKRRRPRKKKETVAHLIDNLLESLNQ